MKRLCIAILLASGLSAGTITDLGLVPQHSVPTLGISNNGKVVGTVSTVDGDRAFLYSGGAFSYPGTLGGTNSYAAGVNNSGEFTGTSDTTGDATVHAFVAFGGNMFDLGTLGGSFSTGTAINATDQIVGTSAGLDGWGHAFEYYGGHMYDLGTLGGVSSQAAGINDSGVVVGTSAPAGSTTIHAFLYDGSMHDLGTLGGNQSNAFAINNSGQVVGDASTGTGEGHAFLYQNGAMQDLGTLGGTGSHAYGINNGGQIVGTSLTAGNSAQDAFLYSGGVMTDLNSVLPVNSGWQLTYANAINDSGEIAGWGFFNGAYHNFLLDTSDAAASATPEPGSFTLIAAGALLIALGIRKRKPGKLTAALLAAVVCILPAKSASITDLGTLGGTFSTATGVNNSGEVAGYSSLASDTVYHAFKYSAGSMLDLLTLGGTNSYGTGINATGVMSVYSQMAGDVINRGVIYSPGTTYIDTLGGASNYALAINDSSQVTGVSLDHFGQSRAFVSDAFGNSHTIGDLGGFNSVGQGINNAGQIVGASALGNGDSHAFLSDGVTMTDLGVLGGSDSQATAINASGQIVGASDTATINQSHAFLYSGNQMTDLGTLGGALSIAESINVYGDVVGQAELTGNLAFSAFIYTGGVMQDLNSFLPANSGWILTTANGINDLGQVVGLGSIGGVGHAFLLDTGITHSAPESTPEPGSFFLMGAAAAAVLARRLCFRQRAA